MASSLLRLLVLGACLVAAVGQPQPDLKCDRCKELVAAKEAYVVKQAAAFNEKVQAACDQQPDDQKEQCKAQAQSEFEAVLDYIKANPPAVLCAKAGQCLPPPAGTSATNCSTLQGRPAAACASLHSVLGGLLRFAVAIADGAALDAAALTEVASQ